MFLGHTILTAERLRSGHIGASTTRASGHIAAVSRVDLDADAACSFERLS